MFVLSTVFTIALMPKKFKALYKLFYVFFTTITIFTHLLPLFHYQIPTVVFLTTKPKFLLHFSEQFPHPILLFGRLTFRLLAKYFDFVVRRTKYEKLRLRSEHGTVIPAQLRPALVFWA